KFRIRQGKTDDTLGPAVAQARSKGSRSGKTEEKKYMSFRNGKRLLRCWCTAFAFSLFGTLTLAAPAFAQTCLQNEYNIGNGAAVGSTASSLALNCTANDVRIAEVTNIRDPLTGATLTSCIQGARFNFIADFEIVTRASTLPPAARHKH
ncbi:MAG: hypothetical protein DMG27_08895, partial [Acidobacteria bacterium]